MVSDDLVLLDHYGDALLKTGEVKKAIEVYQRAIEKEVRKNDREQIEARRNIEHKLRTLREQYPE